MSSYSSFGKRFVAGLIDLVIFGVLYFFIYYLLILLIEPRSAGGVVIIFSITCIMFFFEIVLFWHYFKATPGKMLLKMQVVDATDGSKPGLGKLVLRCLLYPASLLPVGFGFWWIFFDSRRQAAHDKLSGTLVIYKPKTDQSDEETAWQTSSDKDNKRFALIRIVMVVCSVVLLIVVPGFLYLLGTDEPLSDLAREWFPEETEIVPVEQNAFYLAKGFAVPADIDPVQAAVNWVEAENERIKKIAVAPPGTVSPQPYVRRVNGQVEKIVSDPIFAELKKATPRIRDVSIVDSLIKSSAEIESLYYRSMFLKERFDKLGQLEQFSTALIPFSGAEFPNFLPLLRYQKFLNAWIIIQYQQGNREKAIAELDHCIQLSRKYLGKVDNLLARLVFQVMLTMEVDMVNILLDIENEPSEALIAFINNLRSLSSEELSFRRAFQFEGRLKTDADLFSNKRMKNKDNPVRLSISYLVIKPNSTSNLVARLFEWICGLSEMSGVDYMKLHNNEFAGAGITDIIRNGYSAYLLVGERVYLEYVSSSFYLSGYVTLLKAKTDILTNKVKVKEVESYLAAKKVVYNNIFTGEALEWDAKNQEISFTGPNPEHNEDGSKIKIRF